jgi:hypothetical protein
MPESESEGSGLVSTEYENGRPPKRNCSMSSSNGAAAGWSSTVSEESMQVAEQAPSPAQVDEEGSDSGSESWDNEVINDSTYDDAIDDQQESIQNTAVDSGYSTNGSVEQWRLEQGWGVTASQQNNMGNQNGAAGVVDNTDVIQQTPPSTPTGQEYRSVVDFNNPPNAPHRPVQIREGRPSSRRGNGRRFLSLPDDAERPLGDFGQIHDLTRQANEVQQNTHSTLYMSVIFEALRQSNIGGDYENHPYRDATRTLYHTNDGFRTFVDNLRNAFNIIINTHGESEVRGYLDFEQNRTYLPADIQETIIEMAGLSNQLLELYNSNSGLEREIELRVERQIPIAVIVNPDGRDSFDRLMFGYPLQTQVEGSGNTNTGEAEEGNNSNGGHY